MRKALSLFILFLLACLWQGAGSYAHPLCTSIGSDDSTVTGGSLPGMGWGDTANTTAIQKVQTQADTALCHDLSGKAVENNSKTIIIKNGKCRIIKR